MPKCTWRDKPGSPENCVVLADAGEDMCPRHKMMKVALGDIQTAKDLKAAVNRKHHGPQPKSRRELLEQGYAFIGNDTCECGKAIEYWRTPNKKVAPYDSMATLESPSNSHFIFCRQGLNKYYRRAS